MEVADLVEDMVDQAVLEVVDSVVDLVDQVVDSADQVVVEDMVVHLYP